MAHCPDTINGVQLQFAASVDRRLHVELLRALRAVIRPDLLPGRRLVLHVSSISEAEGHAPRSRHYPPPRKAIDISQINGHRMAVHYPSHPDVAHVTRELQRRFEAFAPARRENFGPYLMRKSGQPVASESLRKQHRSHVHFSVTTRDER